MDGRDATRLLYCCVSRLAVARQRFARGAAPIGNIEGLQGQAPGRPPVTKPVGDLQLIMNSRLSERRRFVFFQEAVAFMTVVIFGTHDIRPRCMPGSAANL